ncbi:MULTISPECIES: SDR family oxidoreductase [Mycobacterium]|uniref:SDR family NAD(P)-dependent oxidoreductase n=1 Tax=Mycobacterium colombiense TaxID=339268 RepID=A0A329LLW8_9MYCO|nr:MULTISPECIES: SDR family oxidoreductase [Mycobacterium]MDM4142059.1 SDR family oxidoreductase [Mycobacterium sp. FLAC0960]RAV09165.1 SDR family NAD(P)-dependent oxidoreductase [Mycobacterium colombiense]
MASSVSGKVAFITGGASGIGAALATKLVDGGAEVWLADRQLEAARRLAQRLGTGDKKAGKAHAVELDVRDYPAFEAAVAEAVRTSGRIDYLFNNAGIGVGGEVDSYSLEDWNDVLDVNLHGVVHGIQAVYPIMIQQRSGHIVNTASMAGLLAGPGTVSYTASKHAVVALSRALRLEAERHNVKVSVLCPGAIRTPILTGGVYGRMTNMRASEGDILKSWEPTRPMAPDKFAERVLRAVLRNHAIVIVPAWWKALWYLDRLSPTLSTGMARLVLRRMRELDSSAS